MVEQPMPQFRRRPAAKMFVAEVKESTYALPKSGQDEMESQTFLTPTGEIVSKVMIAGTAVEKEDVGKDQSFWRLRVVDSTGGIAVFAGQYQVEAAQVIAGLEIPCHVLVAGKLSIYEPENGNKILSIRPESVTAITQEDRNSFLLDASEQLAARIKAPKNAERVKEVYPQWDSKLLAKAAVDALRDLVEPKTGQGVEQTAQPPAEPAEKPAAPAGTPDETKPPETPAKSKGVKKTKDKEAPATEKTKKQAADIKDLIEDVVKAHVKGCTYTAMINELKARGVNPGMVDVDGAISRLMKEGRLYEPKIGMLTAP